MAAPAWLTARPIAHRGYHDMGPAGSGRGIENTLPAAEAAIARNFAIECDLQPTADGAVVVFHDDTLDRLTDLTGPVAAKTLAEVRRARFKDGDAFIPTLENLLDLVDGRVPLVIELKSRFNGDRRLEAAAAAILSAYTGPAVVMSFDPASMAAMRRLAPTLPRGMLADRFAARRLAGNAFGRPACLWLAACRALRAAELHCLRRERAAGLAAVGAAALLPPAPAHLDGADQGQPGDREDLG